MDCVWRTFGCNVIHMWEFQEGRSKEVYLSRKKNTLEGTMAEFWSDNWRYLRLVLFGLTGSREKPELKTWNHSQVSESAFKWAEVNVQCFWFDMNIYGAAKKFQRRNKKRKFVRKLSPIHEAKGKQENYAEEFPFLYLMYDEGCQSLYDRNIACLMRSEGNNWGLTLGERDEFHQYFRFFVREALRSHAP